MTDFVIEHSTQAVIYVHSLHFNSFLSGWGAVVSHEGEPIELHGSSEGEEEANRLLLRATLRALEVVPDFIPVKIVTPSEYVAMWVIGRLSEICSKSFPKTKKAKLKNLDLIKELRRALRSRVLVEAQYVRAGQRDQHMSRAMALASACTGNSPAAFRDSPKPKSKPRSPKEIAEEFASSPSSWAVSYDDLIDVIPWD